MSENKNQELMPEFVANVLKDLYKLKNHLKTANIIDLKQLSRLTESTFDSFLVVLTIQHGFNPNEKDDTDVKIPLNIQSLIEFKNKRTHNKLQTASLKDRNIKDEYIMQLVQIQNLTIDIILELNKKKLDLQTLNPTINTEDIISIHLTQALVNRIGDNINYEQITKSYGNHKE